MSATTEPHILIRLWGIIPISVLHFFGYILGSLLFILSFLFTNKRKKIFAVIRKCGFENPNYILFKYLQVLSCAILDYPFWWLNHDSRIKRHIFLDDRQGILTKYQNKPVIFIGGHLSSTEVIGRLVGCYRQPVTFLYQGSKNQNLQKFHNIRSTLSKFIPISSKQPSALRQIIRNLKKNGSVIIYPDMPSPKESSVEINFFNNPSWMMILPMKLKELSESDTKVVYFETIHSFAKYSIILSDITEQLANNNITENIQKVNDIIEVSIKKHPEQYLWFSNKFRK